MGRIGFDRAAVLSKLGVKLRPLALAGAFGLVAFAQTSGPAAASAAAQAPSGRVHTAQASMAPTTMLQRVLADRVAQLGRDFNGDVGIAVRDVQTGWTTAFDGNTYFPQQSVSKFWVAITALDRVDRGELSLDQRVTLTRSDLTLFH